jgi:phosphotransferase system IIB component
MNKNLILSSIMFGIIFGAIYHLIISDNITETIVYTLGFIILSTILEVILKKRREKKESVSAVSIDNAEVEKFIDAIGGQTNIASASHEVSRVKISLKDVDLINQDKLKALELDGAFLSGDQLQVTFGKQAEGVALQISEQIK